MSKDTGEKKSPEAMAAMILDLFHRSMVHYGLWFAEVRHQLGSEKSHAIITKVSGNVLDVYMNRFAKILGVPMKDGLPAPLLDLPVETLETLREAVSLNWLALDGLWFQGVEFAHGMNDAKRCNDSCWAHFSPFEAAMIRKSLGLGKRAGLEGLKKALNHRLYAFINEQSIEDTGPDRFVFRMHKCRVQDARKRKGLEDYPCKSAGMVEYPFFASELDSRIRTHCIGCPPDAHPEEWWCAWEFILEENEG
ncbi:DUF6125 family protein [Desulfobotulus sp.]|jgi:hypothetical protein|uniref:DUF6125 family protein n=1 Tax=Desulfobotulus sp. TaxID=1940337 RepID=UPI002A3700A6|nr:DUF6125 family protein [Desulfobotulus sp.]MDY0163000.1 DUF6125 family protein [Desulfobotulus sp.]